MMKLYAGAESGNTWKIRILLEQLGIPYETVTVDMPNAEHKSTRFLSEINPRGQVPVLEDDGRRIWDSAAIMVYIARKYDRSDWLPVDAGPMAEVMQWISLSATEIQFGLQYCRRGVIRSSWVIGDASCKPQYHVFARTALDTMERRLKDHDWLALDRITIADLACFPYVFNAADADLSLEAYPGIRAWLTRCTSRPGWASPPEPPPRHYAQEPQAAGRKQS